MEDDNPSYRTFTQDEIDALQDRMIKCRDPLDDDMAKISGMYVDTVGDQEFLYAMAEWKVDEPGIEPDESMVSYRDLTSSGDYELLKGRTERRAREEWERTNRPSGQDIQQHQEQAAKQLEQERQQLVEEQAELDRLIGVSGNRSLADRVSRFASRLRDRGDNECSH